MKNKLRKNLNQSDTGEHILLISKEYRDSCGNDEIINLIDEFNNTKSVEQQIVYLHSFAGILTSTSNRNSEIVLRILTSLFLASNSKHPVKKSILRTFAGAKNLEKLISVELSTQLLELLDSKEQNDVVNNINDCFNNFSAGITTISLIVDRIFPFLVNSLRFYCTELCRTSSPVAIQEIFKQIHNSTRAIVAVSQQCENINEIFETHIDSIVQICIEIFTIPDISYDTKNNCGIILTIAANISLENGYEKLLNTCTDENAFITEWKIGYQNLNNEITIACIFSGILNTVKSRLLSENSLFKMTERLLEISKNSADKPSVILGANRTLLLVSRVLGSLSQINLIEIFKTLLDHTWTQLDHNIDTIRHVSKSILVNLVKLITQKSKSESSDDNILSEIIVDSVLNLPELKTGRYEALSIVSNEIGINLLLNKDPNLIIQLRSLTQEASVSSYAISCYENLMKHNSKETTEEIWLKNWVFPLTTKLSNDEELNEKGSCYQKLLISAIKLRPSIVNLILSRWSTENEVQFCSLLKCALIARKIGTDLREAEKWRGMLDYSVLELAMCHQNDEIRVSSLSLITESHKSTEIFTEWELNFVVNFLHFNINTQPPAVRQRILFSMKKILTRFSESYYAINRNYSKVARTENELLQKNYYEKFVFNLRECIFDSLFPGANFSRRIICLEILTMIEPILNEILKNSEMEEQEIWKQSEVNALKICLDDSYESNKQLAANLLRKCPIELLHLDTLENTTKLIKNALKLASSVKPADTITAAYMLETSMYSPLINRVLRELLNEKQNYSSQYLIINLLLVHLKRQIEIGRKSLLKAAGTSPMYGTLFCIRHLVEKYLFTSDFDDTNWKNLMEDLILSCFQVSEIVCPIVNSSSPEGHLPMDHEIVDSHEKASKEVDFITVDFIKKDSIKDNPVKVDSTKLDSVKVDSTKLDSVKVDSIKLDSIRVDSSKLTSIKKDCIKVDSTQLDSINVDSIKKNTTVVSKAVGSISVDLKAMSIQTVDSQSEESQVVFEMVDSGEVVTAQMLLVCSWRSIKEVSLLLGEITLKGKILGENENGFITEEQVLKIGEHFTVLLTETKHRGAFEQAYVGFNKLCNRLWRCNSSTLHQLPVIWLNDIISAISGEKSSQNHKLCATRRSAGVPFMIQAIVSSELQSGSNNHFHRCMDKLLEFANSPDENIEKRTHSMNILRALYRHTQLGEDISPYIAQGIVASINGFSKKTWAERNAATLLFSSLMTRIFGVQRTKDTDQLNIRNKMTARVFFLRYPTLYQFLLNLLQELTNDTFPHYENITLYPILLLLARLYPSNSNENESGYQLQNFVPYVRLCAKNKTLKTRELAAKALVPLVETQNREKLLKELFTQLANRNESKNYIHGILLQIFYLIRTVKDEILNNLRTEVNNTIWLLRCDTPNCCPVITALYIQIIYNIIIRNVVIFNSVDIFSEISSQDNWIEENAIIGTTIYYREALNLQLTILLREQNRPKITNFLFQQLAHKNQIVKEFILNFLINMLYRPESAVYIDNLELPEFEKKLMSLIPEDFKIDLVNDIKTQKDELTEILNPLFETRKTLLPKILFIISNYKDFNYINFLQKYPADEEIINAIVSTFPKIVKNTDNLPKILDLILETVSSDNFCCRYYSALTLLQLKPVIFGEVVTNFGMLVNIWRVIMILLTDNEPIVRNTISKLAENHPVAEKAREELLSKCIEIIQKISEDKCISLLVFWSLTVFENANDDDDGELQIFERGETSTYVEDMCLSKLCSGSLKRFFNSDNSNIPEIFDKISTIIKKDNLWKEHEEDRENFITVLNEIQIAGNLKIYFESETNRWSHLDVHDKYKIFNILEAILPSNLLDKY